MFLAKLYCDQCAKQISFNEEYFFRSKLQDGLGITNVKKYFKEYGTVWCKDCLKKSFEN